MATGYDNRQEVRATRLTATAPRQYNPRGAAASPTGRSGVVGAGAATGGVVQSQNPTLNIGVGANIPGFLEKVFEPVLQERQTERMYQGMQAAMEGATMQEIQAEQPTLSGLFGATAFEQGASFQHARQGVAEWQNAQLENMSALRELKPEDVSKVLYDGAKPYLTGDNATDSIIHKMVIEASETLIPTITRERIKWRDGQARTSFINGAMAFGGTIQSVMNMDTPDEAAIAASVDSFRASLVKPPHMPAESWAESIGQLGRSLLANKNMRAFTVMDAGGANSVLFQALAATGDATQYQTIKNLAETTSKDLLADWAMQPENRQEIMLLNARIAAREDGYRGADIAEHRDRINAKAMADTGSIVPLYSSTQIATDVENYVNTVASEDRAEANRQLTAAQTADTKATEVALEVATIRQALAVGGETPQGVKVAYGDSKVDNVARMMWQENPAGAIGMLVDNYTNGGHFFGGVRDDIKSMVASGGFAGADTDGFRTSFALWQSFHNLPQGDQARAAYYGDADKLFSAYEARVKGPLAVPPVVAFDETFGRAGVMQGTRSPGQQPQGEVAAAISGRLDSYMPNWMGRVFGRKTSNRDSRAMLQEWVAPEAAQLMKDRGIDAEQAVPIAVEGLLATGQLDRAGSYYWNNNARGPRMMHIAGVTTEDELGTVVEELIREGTRNPTFAGITPETVQITPVPNPGGTTYWIVNGTNRQGQYRGFTLTADMLKGKAQERRSAARARATYNANGGRPPEGVGDPGRLPRPLPTAPRGGLLNVPAAPVQFTSPLFGGFRGN